MLKYAGQLAQKVPQASPDVHEPAQVAGGARRAGCWHLGQLVEVPSDGRL